VAETKPTDFAAIQQWDRYAARIAALEAEVARLREGRDHWKAIALDRIRFLEEMRQFHETGAAVGRG
jgi:cell division protein FtsB